MRNQLSYIGDDAFRAILQFCQFSHIIKITNMNHQTKSINKKELICKYLDYIENNDNIIKLLFFRYIPAISITDLSESLISFMPKIEHLKYLHYDANKTNKQHITPFIQSIGQFEKLESLIILYTIPEDIDMIVLADSLNQLKQLKFLTLDLRSVISDQMKLLNDNLLPFEQLTSFKLIRPYGIFNKHICYIIDKMTHLENLYLSDNGIGDNSIEDNIIINILCNTITQLQHLVTLDLSSNNFDDNSINVLIPMLDNLQTLEYFDISYNHFKNPYIMNYVITHLKNLKIFKIHNSSLRYNHNADISINNVPITVSPANNLLELEIHSNLFSEHDIAGLSIILSYHNKLEELNVGNIWLSEDDMDNLSRVIRTFHQLKILKLGYTRMKNNGLLHLSDTFYHLNQLETLILSNNYITSIGMKIFGNALIHLKQLRLLDLGTNTIEDDGLFYLSSGLSHCSKLTNLNLSKNNITDKGIEHLNNALNFLNQLQTLNLSYNEICELPIKHISQSLTELNLRNNMIGQKNIDNFANLLAKVPYLERIEMKKNFIDDKSMSIINLPMSKFANLKWLDLEQNMLKYDGQHILSQLVPNFSKKIVLLLKEQFNNKIQVEKYEGLWKPLIENNPSIYI